MAANRGQWRKFGPISVNKQCTQTDTVYIHNRPNKYIHIFSSVQALWGSMRQRLEANILQETQTTSQRWHTIVFPWWQKQHWRFYDCQQLHNKRVLLHGHKTVSRSHNKTPSVIKKKTDVSLTGILIKRPSASVNQAVQWEERTFKQSAAWLLHHSWDPPSYHKLACWHQPVFRALNQLCALRLMDWIVTMAVKFHKKKPLRPQERCI